MNKTITSRIEKLRQAMVNKGISAYLINGSDPHIGEYVPSRWQSRAFISGFTGSFGWLAITLKEAALWTDSRYYLQAGIQLEGTGIEILKARLPETIFIGDWVSQRLLPGEVVGFDGTCYSYSEVKILETSFATKSLKIEYRVDLLNEIWIDRPEITSREALLHPIEWAGVSRKEKLSIITNEIEKWGAGLTIVTSLDDLCWAFNIRGADVDYNPVVIGFGIIGNHGGKLFVQPGKFNYIDTIKLVGDGIEILPYDKFLPFISSLSGRSILIDPERTNYSIKKLLEGRNRLVEAPSVPRQLKSRKNESEINGMKKAMVSDGLALLDFQSWLEKTLGNEIISEFDVAQKLTEYRSKMPGYRSDSFYPVVGYKEHGAIVHFDVTPDVAKNLSREGVLLLDSGGQYEFGTTDITRTIALGEVSYQIRYDFTLVLKGMIALSNIRFPKGTHGCHLDILARQSLWRNHLNYGHGTGHGVGSYLNVHEGPGSIRQDLNNQPICPGNIFSNEPGIYRTGEYGIRIENLIYCIEDTVNEFGEFYRFETLTLFPIDTRLIEKSLLIKEEIDWINHYHQKVLYQLKPFATPEQKRLLTRLTKRI